MATRALVSRAARLSFNVVCFIKVSLQSFMHTVIFFDANVVELHSTNEYQFFYMSLS